MVVILDGVMTYRIEIRMGNAQVPFILQLASGFRNENVQVRSTRYNINVIMFVSDLRQIGGLSGYSSFLHQ